MNKLKECLEEQFKRYEKDNDLKAFEAALEAAKKKYVEEMDKVCYLETIVSSFYFLSYTLFLSLSLTLFLSPYVIFFGYF